LTTYVAALALFFVVLTRVYGFWTLGRVANLTPGAVCARDQLFGSGRRQLFQASRDRGFKHRETAVLIFVATTLPQFFLDGASWPREMIPPTLDYIRRIFPSESTIDGLVRIGQMGAGLREVRADWLYLWLLSAIYFALAVAASRRRAAIEAINAF
jgi:ABC-2 type transport system permease protein